MKTYTAAEYADLISKAQHHCEFGTDIEEFNQLVDEAVNGLTDKQRTMIIGLITRRTNIHYGAKDFFKYQNRIVPLYTRPK